MVIHSGKPGKQAGLLGEGPAGCVRMGVTLEMLIGREKRAGVKFCILVSVVVSL